MPKLYHSPPNWPPPPPGWRPPPGWQPDPAWGQAPDGWRLEVPANPHAVLRSLAVGVAAYPLVLVYLAVLGDFSSYTAGYVFPLPLLGALLTGVIVKLTATTRWRWQRFALLVGAVTVLLGLVCANVAMAKPEAARSAAVSAAVLPD